LGISPSCCQEGYGHEEYGAQRGLETVFHN
jgi:hypothetical protein